MSCCSLVTRDVSVTGEIPPVVIATPSRTRCDAVRSEGFSDREMHDPAPDDRPQALRRGGPGGEDAVTGPAGRAGGTPGVGGEGGPGADALLGGGVERRGPHGLPRRERR